MGGHPKSIALITAQALLMAVHPQRRWPFGKLTLAIKPNSSLEMKLHHIVDRRRAGGELLSIAPFRSGVLVSGHQEPSSSSHPCFDADQRLGSLCVAVQGSKLRQTDFALCSCGKTFGSYGVSSVDAVNSRSRMHIAMIKVGQLAEWRMSFKCFLRHPQTL